MLHRLVRTGSFHPPLGACPQSRAIQEDRRTRAGIMKSWKEASEGSGAARHLHEKDPFCASWGSFLQQLTQHAHLVPCPLLLSQMYITTGDALFLCEILSPCWKNLSGFMFPLLPMGDRAGAHQAALKPSHKGDKQGTEGWTCHLNR